MNIKVNPSEVVTLRKHLATRQYNVMHIRRTFTGGTLLGGIALQGESIVGIFSYGPKHMFEFKVNFEKSRITFEVKDSFSDKKMAARLEDWLFKYIGDRVLQEQAWDEAEEKHHPRYKAGEIYLRRRLKSRSSELLNKRHSTESGLVNMSFAERLSDLNLVLRFKKPKH